MYLVVVLDLVDAAHQTNVIVVRSAFGGRYEAISGWSGMRIKSLAIHNSMLTTQDL
jgi:hypothetical protein